MVSYVIHAFGPLTTSINQVVVLIIVQYSRIMLIFIHAQQSSEFQDGDVDTTVLQTAATDAVKQQRIRDAKNAKKREKYHRDKAARQQERLQLCGTDSSGAHRSVPTPPATEAPQLLPGLTAPAVINLPPPAPQPLPAR